VALRRSSLELISSIRGLRPPFFTLFTETGPVSDPVAKRARSVAGCALLHPHKPTPLVQLPTNPTAPLPIFRRFDTPL
ncbi:MAG: hypothetical protein AAFR39_08610, partial [Pseudomonadota bacterium]